MNDLIKKTILLVEDEALIAMAEKKTLDKFGYDVLTVNSGKKAITAFNSNKIDLILMDIDLGGGIDGTETAEIILKDNDVPVVFLSSHTEPEIVGKTEKITSYGYVVKNSGNTILDASIKMAFKLFDEKQNVRKHQEELQAKNEDLESTNEELEKSQREILKREQDLLVSESNLKDTQYFALVGNWELDLATSKVTWTDELYRIMKVDPDADLDIGEVMEEMIHPDDKAIGEKAIMDALATGELKPFEFRATRGDGKKAVFWTKGKVIKNAGGEPVKIIGINQDITERKQSDEALKESEEKFKILVNNSLAGVYIVLDEKIKYCNQRFADMWGYDNPEEIIILDIQELVDPKSLSRIKKEIGQRISGEKEVAHYDIKGIKKNGELIDVEVLGSSILYNGKRAAQGMLIDITGRKKAEEALRESEEKYRTLIENIPGVSYRCLYDEHWTMEFISEEIEILSGYPASDFLQNTVRSWASIIHPEGKQAVEEHAIEQIEKKEPYSLEYRIICSDGEIHWVYEKGQGVFDEHGQVKFLDGVIVDITERKQTEKALENSSQQNKDLLKELQHRAKNSFNMISSMISLTAESSKSDDTKTALNEVGSRIKAVSEMYDLLYATDSVTEVQLDEYINKVVSSLSIASENITLKKDCEAIIIPVKKAISIGIIVTELITNSIKHAFSKNRKGIISLSLKKTSTGAVIEIKDNGKGLPDEFDITALDSMGLTLVNVLVKQIDGSFKIESKNGTHSTVEFPIEEDASD